ncbi:MAG: response regulator [Myxococcales bacterium]|nr:response regulator [Myxococcales bacterium]
MLAGTPLALVVTALFVTFSDDVPSLPRAVMMLPLASLVACYGLARTRHWRAGAWLVMVVVGSISMVQMAVRAEPYMAMFVALTITLGAMVLRKRDIVLLMALTLLGFFTMPLWSGAEFSSTEQVLVGGFFVMLSLTLWISVALRERLEQERLDALAKSEARFRGLLQLAFEGLVELKDGRIVELNPGFVAITGRSESELRGRELSSVMHGSERPAMPTGSSTASHPIYPSTREASGTRPNGEVFYVEMVSRTLSTERGPIEYVAVRDVTERRKAELQLSIAHRAVALGTLSAGIAHEINNPLSWMMTNLQMAQDELRRGGLGRRRTPEQDSLLHTLDDALQGGRRVMSIVRDLKTMSREGGDHGVADVHAALDLACRIASRQIEARARLVRDYGHVPSVCGSAGRLGQVFLNLLTNAAQAVPEGQRDAHRITLRTRSRKGEVIVSIRDTGQGIPATVLPHIFDPFYTTKDKEGTGLGLSITRSVVDGLGGSISVESSVGDGTTFIVRLPVAERQLEPDAPDQSLPSRTSIETMSASEPVPRVRVLVIDDEPLLGKSLRRALPEHDVVYTEDPTHALDLCSETDFDVIVCDLMMPVIDGQDVYEHLRQNAPELASRMIFMTGGAFTTAAQRFLESIDNPVLHKPFTPNDLRVAVKRMLESHAA